MASPVEHARSAMLRRYYLTTDEVQAINDIVRALPRVDADTQFNPPFSGFLASTSCSPVRLAHRLKVDLIQECYDAFRALKRLVREIQDVVSGSSAPLLIVSGLPATEKTAATIITVLSTIGDWCLLEYVQHSAPVDAVQRKAASWDIRPRSSNALYFFMHTDLSFDQVPPPYVFFLLQRPAKKGGASLFCDMRDGATELPPRMFSTLQESVPFLAPPHRPESGTQYFPIITIDIHGRANFRYRVDGIDYPKLTTAQRGALQSFEELLMVRAMSVTLQSGELAIFDNKVILHGRDGFEDGHIEHERRLAFRTYVSLNSWLPRQSMPLVTGDRAE